MGKSQFPPTWVEIIKQNVAFSFHGSNSGSLFTLRSPVFPAVFVVVGCSQSAGAAPVQWE